MAADVPPRSSSKARLYHNLSLGDIDYIRVLDLYPRLRGTRLQGHLRLVLLHSGARYEALSYTWGENTQGRRIALNDGIEVDMTDNLHQALYRMRNALEVRTLWVDALCINQEDEVERGRQVAQMGLVYKNAMCVNVWLGEPGAVPAFSPTMSRLLRQKYFRGKHKQFPNAWRALEFHPEAIEQALSKTSPCWHDRVWVAQEYILAAEVYFCYGSQRVQEDSRFLDNAFQRAAPDMEHFQAFLQRWRLWKALRKRPDAVDSIDEPDDSLNSFQGKATWAVAACSSIDPRDRVYGLLGTLHPLEAARIHVDYTLSCGEVFAMATAAPMTAYQTHIILQLVDLSDDRMPGLPSWSVNYQTVNSMSVKPDLRAKRFATPLNFSRTRPVKYPEYLTHASPSLRTLRILGHQCGTVVSILELNTVHRCEAFNNRAIRASEASTVAMQNSQHPIHDCESYLFTQMPNSQGREVRGLKSKPSLTMFIGQSLGHLILQAEDCTVQKLQDVVKHWISCVLNARNNLHVPNWDKESTVHLAKLYRFVAYALAASSGCCLFLTAGGHVGVAPLSIAVGDKVILVSGERCPFLLLRQVQHHYLFRGLALMHGLEFPSLGWYHCWEKEIENLATGFDAMRERDMFEIR